MPIREATTDDAVQIALVQASSSQEAYKGILPAKEITDEFIESRVHIWEEFVRLGKTRIYVYEHEYTVIGFIHFGPCRDADLQRENTGEIWAMYVAPLHWRRGTGDQLMNKALNEIAKLGFVTVSLWVLKENQNAIEFYQKVGFRPDGTVKAHHSGAAEIRMVKCI